MLCPLSLTYTQIYSDMHRDTQAQRHTDTGTNACEHVRSHACTLAPRLPLRCWEPVPFVWPQKGPVTGLNGPPAPTQHDSFRQIVPRACLVAVPATRAGQVVRGVPAWAEHVPGRLPPPPSQLGPEGSPGSSPSAENGDFTLPPPGGRPSCAPAGPRLGQACRQQPPLPPLTQQGPPWPIRPFHVQAGQGPCEV